MGSDIHDGFSLTKTLHMFTSELILTSDEFEEKVDKKSDGLVYKSVTTKTDTKSSCNSMPERSEDSESWTFVEIESNQEFTDDFTENSRHNQWLKNTKKRGYTGDNAKEVKMDQNCSVLRAQSLKFFEDSKFKRDYEWTSSYFAKENSDVSQQKDKDLNGNYGYLALANKTELSSAIICENSSPPLCTPKQSGKSNGFPVLEQQGGHGTSHSLDVNFSQSCAVISNDTSVISAYKDIKQVGDDIPGYLSPREGNLVSSLQRQHFEKLSSHDVQSTRNAAQDLEIATNIKDNNDTSSDMEEDSEKEPQRVIERVILWEKKSIPREVNGNLTDTSSGLKQDSYVVTGYNARAVSREAKLLTLKTFAQEEQIVPVSVQRQSVCYGGLFEENLTVKEKNCGTDDGDEIVVMAVCDDGNDGTVDAVANNDADGVIIHVNNNGTDGMEKWHNHNGCHGDDTNMLQGRHQGNDSDGCYGDETNMLQGSHHGNNSDGCHGDGRHGDTVDHHDEDDEMIANGGNPFDLDESEYEKLMEAIDDSFDSLLDTEHPEASVLEHDTGNPLDSCDLTGKSTEQSSNEKDTVIEEIITPFDESECNALITDDLFWGSEEDSKCDENQGEDFEQQSESLKTNNDLARNLHQVQSEESPATQDTNSVELAEAEINFTSLHENRTDDKISELDKYGMNPNSPSDAVSESLMLVPTENSMQKDNTRLAKDRESQDDIQEQSEPAHVNVPLKANNDALVDDGVSLEAKEDYQDEIKVVLVNTSSKSIVERVTEEMRGEGEEEEASSLLKMEPSTEIVNVGAKEDGMRKVHFAEDDQDQENIELSITMQDDEDQKSIDADDFFSLLVWHGIITPQDEPALSNEDPAGTTRELPLQERIQNINKAFEWVRKELQEMRGVDVNLKVQFDGLRQEARTLREDYEMFVNCEYYDDDEIFDEAAEYTTCQKDTRTHPVEDDDRDKGTPCIDSRPLLQNALREDSGYHSDTPSTSTDAGSTDNDKPNNATHAHAKYYYQPQPTHPKIQELTSGKCVFELLL